MQISRSFRNFPPTLANEAIVVFFRTPEKKFLLHHLWQLLIVVFVSKRTNIRLVFSNSFLKLTDHDD